MVHRRELEGRPIVLGSQGDLYGGAMTWWDHETGSVWSQPTAEAIAGPLRGSRLELLPSTLTTWNAWRTAHPTTRALDVHGWRTGFSLDDMAIVVDEGSEAEAFSIRAVRVAGVANEIVGGRNVAVVIDPTDPARWAVFDRQLDDSVAVLSITGDGLVDSRSGTVYDPFLGIGRSGPLAGQPLAKLPAFTILPEDFATFFPDGRVWDDSDGS